MHYLDAHDLECTQQTLYAESGSYSELESQSTISSEDDNINWVLLGPIAGAAAAFVIATLIIIFVIYCYRSNRDKKITKSPTKISLW